VVLLLVLVLLSIWAVLFALYQVIKQQGRMLLRLDSTERQSRVKTQLTMLRFNGLVNRIGGPTDAGELVLV